MRVRFRTICAGPDGCWRPGDEVELADEFASRLIAAHAAESLEQPTAEPVIEAAAMAPPAVERAAPPPPTPTRKRG